MEDVAEPTTTWGAALDRYRWVSEFALAATTLANPTSYDDGLRLHEAATSYARFHAWQSEGPLDIRIAVAHPEFRQVMDREQVEDVVDRLQRLYDAITSHRAAEPECRCVLHAGAAFDTGRDIGWLIKVAGQGSESADELARADIRHPWMWAADAALAALELADVSATADGLELAVGTVGALAHFASTRQARLLRGVDALSPEALDAFAITYRWATGWDRELDRLVGALVAIHVSENPDCECKLCVPVLGDFGANPDGHLAGEDRTPSEWVVLVATTWGYLAGADARLVLTAATHAAAQVTDHPRVMTEGIDLDKVALHGPQRFWAPAGDSVWKLLTALAVHKFEGHCTCVLCGADRGY